MNRDANEFLRVVESILKRMHNEKSEEKPEAEQAPQKKVEPEKPEAKQLPQKKVEPRQMRLFDLSDFSSPTKGNDRLP